MRKNTYEEQFFGNRNFSQSFIDLWDIKRKENLKIKIDDDPFPRGNCHIEVLCYRSLNFSL